VGLGGDPGKRVALSEVWLSVDLSQAGGRLVPGPGLKIGYGLKRRIRGFDISRRSKSTYTIRWHLSHKASPLVELGLPCEILPGTRRAWGRARPLKLLMFHLILPKIPDRIYIC
jgi:hypothetical protein